jgi:hypothetical protein
MLDFLYAFNLTHSSTRTYSSFAKAGGLILFVQGSSAGFVLLADTLEICSQGEMK